MLTWERIVRARLNGLGCNAPLQMSWVREIAKVAARLYRAGLM
jgi:hypothetical protein